MESEETAYNIAAFFQNPETDITWNPKILIK